MHNYFKISYNMKTFIFKHLIQHWAKPADKYYGYYKMTRRMLPWNRKASALGE
jgi:hypothetical protein